MLISGSERSTPTETNSVLNEFEYLPKAPSCKSTTVPETQADRTSQGVNMMEETAHQDRDNHAANQIEPEKLRVVAHLIRKDFKLLWPLTIPVSTETQANIRTKLLLPGNRSPEPVWTKRLRIKGSEATFQGLAETTLLTDGDVKKCSMSYQDILLEFQNEKLRNVFPAFRSGSACCIGKAYIAYSGPVGKRQKCAQDIAKHSSCRQETRPEKQTLSVKDIREALRSQKTDTLNRSLFSPWQLQSAELKGNVANVAEGGPDAEQPIATGHYRVPPKQKALLCIPDRGEAHKGHDYVFEAKSNLLRTHSQCSSDGVVEASLSSDGGMIKAASPATSRGYHELCNGHDALVELPVIPEANSNGTSVDTYGSHIFLDIPPIESSDATTEDCQVYEDSGSLHLASNEKHAAEFDLHIPGSTHMRGHSTSLRSFHNDISESETQELSPQPKMSFSWRTSFTHFAFADSKMEERRYGGINASMLDYIDDDCLGVHKPGGNEKVSTDPASLTRTFSLPNDIYSPHGYLDATTEISRAVGQRNSPTLRWSCPAGLENIALRCIKEHGERFDDVGGLSRRWCCAEKDCCYNTSNESARRLPAAEDGFAFQTFSKARSIHSSSHVASIDSAHFDRYFDMATLDCSVARIEALGFVDIPSEDISGMSANISDGDNVPEYDANYVIDKGDNQAERSSYSINVINSQGITGSFLEISDEIKTKQDGKDDRAFQLPHSTVLEDPPGGVEDPGVSYVGTRFSGLTLAKLLDEFATGMTTEDVTIVYCKRCTNYSERHRFRNVDFSKYVTDDTPSLQDAIDRIPRIFCKIPVSRQGQWCVFECH